MLDILLLVLQIATLILLFLFIWWVVRSARRDLVRSVEGAHAGDGQQPLPWDAGGWPPPNPTEAAGVAWPSSTASAGPEWGWQTAAADMPPPETSGPYAAAAAAVAAAPDVTAGEQRSPVSSPRVVPTRHDERASQRAAAEGLDTTAKVHARLVVESSSLLTPGQEIPLEGWLGIGRSPASDLTLNDPFVSTTHARIVPRGQTFFVEDLGSTNGTYVNERQVAEAQLKLDTRLRIGETVFRYEE